MKFGMKAMVLFAVFGVAIAKSRSATTVPVLDALVTGSSIVSGTASPGSSPIDIFDTSYAAKTKIGSANATSSNGKFYCAVKPPLLAGHKVIAIDKKGNVSAIATVAQGRGTVSPAPQ